MSIIGSDEPTHIVLNNQDTVICGTSDGIARVDNVRNACITGAAIGFDTEAILQRIFSVVITAGRLGTLPT